LQTEKFKTEKFGRDVLKDHFSPSYGKKEVFFPFAGRAKKFFPFAGQAKKFERDVLKDQFYHFYKVRGKKGGRLQFANSGKKI